jgi:hypothetical protein
VASVDLFLEAEMLLEATILDPGGTLFEGVEIGLGAESGDLCGWVSLSD